MLVLVSQIYALEYSSQGSGDIVEGLRSGVATRDSISPEDPEVNQEPQEDLEETQVGEVEEDIKSIAKDIFDQDDEHHLCTLLLYFISKTLLNHLRNDLEETPMDRFAEQFFGRQDQSSRTRLPQDPSFMETFAKNLAKSAAKSAAKRAMGQSYSEKRSRDGVRSSGQIGPEDFRGVAEFVLGMLGSKNEQPKRDDDDSKKDRKRKRDKAKDRSRDVPRSRDVDDEGDRYGSDKERRKRRRHRVTFAEPYYDPRQEEESYYQQPYEPRHREYNDQEQQDKEERRQRRRQRRYRRDLDLKTLKTELEAMSSTIISLNARGAQHRDCEFYDRFVRKGGRLQDVIGSTLGQIRGLQEGDDEATERRRRRDKRRERGREKGQRE
ncbi:hypothetical protein FHETE_7204 [Fusarium heterosporum]|uniref:Uncharacterized protein n=1 Tax=Fusarium heterosporum TaxID=42747 RepID=A0A8H5T6V3_FUSHE|nr:hypothetical protein FHETE_7204 [Fusarium heterosporum]